MQQYSCVLSRTLGLPLLALRSNWHFCQQFIKSLLSATPFPPHLQASRELGLTRLLWRGCYWLSVLAACPPFFQLCFETQSKFKKKEKKNRYFCSLYSHQCSCRRSVKHGCERSSTVQVGLHNPYVQERKISYSEKRVYALQEGRRGGGRQEAKMRKKRAKRTLWTASL